MVALVASLTRRNISVGYECLGFAKDNVSKQTKNDVVNSFT